VGDLVWARFLPSPYWPGVINEIKKGTAIVTWCGEGTYNEIPLNAEPYMEPFMAAFATRFCPTKKDPNKKFCVAVAEAINILRPSKSHLNFRLNFQVAFLLIRDHKWDLRGLSVCKAKKWAPLTDVEITKAQGVVKA